MAQTALAFNMDKVVGITMGLTDKQVEKIVKKRLKDYASLPGLIRTAELAAAGKGLTTVRSRPGKREEELATVGRAYTVGYDEMMHRQKAASLFGGMKGDDAEDQQALGEIASIMTGDVVIWKGNVVSYEEALQLADQDVNNMRAEWETIDRALADLEAVDKYGAIILRRQYIEGWSVVKTTVELVEQLRNEESDEEKREQIDTVGEATYHRWRKDGIKLFGKLVGLC